MKKTMGVILSMILLLMSMSALAEEMEDISFESYDISETVEINDETAYVGEIDDISISEYSYDESFDTSLSGDTEISDYSLSAEEDFGDEYAAVSGLSFSYSKPIKGYVISTGNVTVYQTSTSTTKYGTIYGNEDEIRITGHSGSRLRVTYPISNGSKTGWINEKEVTGGCLGSPSGSYIANEKITTYRRSDLSQSYGSISKGDTVYTINSNGNASQVVYPISGGWKIAWIKSDPDPIPNTGPESGTYTIVSCLSSNKVVDIDNASNSAGANVQLYESNGTNAQIFDVIKSGNWYTIKSKCSGKVLDVDNASRKSGTNVWQWDPNGTDAQKWYFENAGNGYYYIKSALGNYLDVSGGYTNNGTNIQVYSFNGTSAHKWKLVRISSDVRGKVIEKARQMVEIEWTAPCDFPTWCSSKGPYNKVQATDGTVSTKFIKNKKYKGIPYSMADHSYDDNKWKAALISGKITTDFMTGKYYKHGKSTTAHGIDCSYFVYCAYKAAGLNVTYQSTASMLSSSQYQLINIDSMKPGDLFLKNGHVMMYVEKKGNKYCVYEADANASKCSYNEYSASYISSYRPYKLRGLN